MPQADRASKRGIAPDWALAKVLDDGVYAEPLHRFMSPETPMSPTRPSMRRSRSRP
jgi:hypothetical protein